MDIQALLGSSGLPKRIFFGEKALLGYSVLPQGLSFRQKSSPRLIRAPAGAFFFSQKALPGQSVLSRPSEGVGGDSPMGHCSLSPPCWRTSYH